MSVPELNVLVPAGSGAREVALLWWLMFWLAAAVAAAVFVGLGAALLRARRRGQAGPDRPLDAPARGQRAIVGLGVLLPAVILAVVFGFTVRALNVLSGPPSREEALTVQVVAHQFWWEFRYLRPGETVAVVTANELALPVGDRVRVELTSSDVIHSFWVPSLQGKMDAVPGQVNQFWIQADRPGRYRGVCAEFCGAQHAGMHLLVRTMTDTGFSEWLAAQAAPAARPVSPAAARGETLFTQRGCAACHTVRGVTARSNLGPDLTHFGSRETLGAGVRVNNRGHLAGWVMNAQGVKRGSLMPPSDLSGEELGDVLAFLEGLQ